MKPEDLLDSMNEIDDSLIEEADRAAVGKNTKKQKHVSARRRRLVTASLAAAAGLAVVVGVSVGVNRMAKQGETGGADSSWTGSLLTSNVVKAAYPEQVVFPKEEDYTKADGSIDWDSYEEAYEAWWESKNSSDADASAESEEASGYDAFLPTAAGELFSDAGTENMVASPLNIYLAMAMLTEGTAGESRDQLLSALHADSTETLRSEAHALWNANYSDDGLLTSVLSNSVWLDDSISYKKETLELLADEYYASSFSGDLGSEEMDEALRGWLDDTTGGLLHDQVEDVTMDPQTILAIASSVYFKGSWTETYAAECTVEDEFRGADGTQTCSYLVGTESTNIYEGSHFTAISSSMSGGAAMWFFLPDEETSPAELASDPEIYEVLADPDNWTGMQHGEVNKKIPKFDVTSDIDLMEFLADLGATDILSGETADFSGILDESYDAALSSAEHAARVKIDEDGCEAAAYTLMMVEETALEIAEPYEFTLDRPFLFAITGPSGDVLFLGVVNHM